ncbi:MULTISPECIES: divergent polysaccharide deacetylase family protein [unclassified Helicobacter]|uniref:divergent polysaccharide deacetylase family protein n=1 Tax=unclassified Helicobacter TaxID=2593540 RepID=UPI0021615FC9|nr:MULTISPECIES: divergent polysaccharide deacetylase family protein [unclassified Helicobacter]
MRFVVLFCAFLCFLQADTLFENLKNQIDFAKKQYLLYQNDLDFKNLDPKDIIPKPTKPKSPKAQKPSNAQNLPKLLIIMDDIKSLEQFNSLRKIGLNITPSIFPKTPASPKTPEITKHTKEYMIHLPLEALKFPQKELEPLPTGASREEILARLKTIKAQFPNLKYLNNHTGSKFTSSYEDMKVLLSVLDELNLRFIDSVTTPDTTLTRISKEQKRLIMQRDIFLDNRVSEESIILQIELAITKAKQKGYAIAICHPRPSTYKALSKMKNKLSKEVELVSPQELESYLIKRKINLYARSKFHHAQEN